MKCMYCEKESEESMYNVCATYDPTGFNWTVIGFCCVCCHAAGATLDYDRSEPPRNADEIPQP